MIPALCIRCGICGEVCPGNIAGPPAVTDGVDRNRCTLCGACVEACPAEARSLVGKRMSVTEVIAGVEKDRVFYEESGGGVTFSGGEPLLQADFLLACLRACKDRGIHTAVDTCGYVPEAVLMEAAAHTDLFLYDVKHMDDARHRTYSGVSNEVILENLKRLMDRGSDVWVRFPLIPGINDDEANLAAMADFMASLKVSPVMNLLPYHRMGSGKYDRLGIPFLLKGIDAPAAEQVALVADRLMTSGVDVKIGG